MRSLVFAAAFLAAAAAAQESATEPEHKPDVPFVTTPQYVVTAMMQLAEVKPADIVYDLGCGDGRMVITAARDFGAHGVCIEINPDLLQRARDNAARDGVEKMIEFRRGDFFKADIHDATVVTIYLLPRVNLELRPKLLAELKPLTRVVSHTFDMGDWKPNKLLSLTGSVAYLWYIPAKK
jgi:SAM-dependent methyltransferase